MEKIGCGFASFKYDEHPEYTGTMCIFIVRTDGSSEDFSFRKCLDVVFGTQSKKHRDVKFGRDKSKDNKRKFKLNINLWRLTITIVIVTYIYDNKAILDGLEESLDDIKSVVDLTISSLISGGRLLYVGAGTSGRLGVLDASECKPTFSVDKELVQGVIAGGERALTESVEGAEDKIDEVNNIIDGLTDPQNLVVMINSNNSSAGKQIAYSAIAVRGNPLKEGTYVSPYSV